MFFHAHPRAAGLAGKIESPAMSDSRSPPCNILVGGRAGRVRVQSNGRGRRIDEFREHFQLCRRRVHRGGNRRRPFQNDDILGEAAPFVGISYRRLQTVKGVVIEDLVAAHYLALAIFDLANQHRLPGRTVVVSNSQYIADQSVAIGFLYVNGTVGIEVPGENHGVLPVPGHRALRKGFDDFPRLTPLSRRILNVQPRRQLGYLMDMRDNAAIGRLLVGFPLPNAVVRPAATTRLAVGEGTAPEPVSAELYAGCPHAPITVNVRLKAMRIIEVFMGT